MLPPGWQRCDGEYLLPVSTSGAVLKNIQYNRDPIFQISYWFSCHGNSVVTVCVDVDRDTGCIDRDSREPIPLIADQLMKINHPHGSIRVDYRSINHPRGSVRVDYPSITPSVRLELITDQLIVQKSRWWAKIQVFKVCLDCAKARATSLPDWSWGNSISCSHEVDDKYQRKISLPRSLSLSVHAPQSKIVDGARSTVWRQRSLIDRNN